MYVQILVFYVHVCMHVRVYVHEHVVVCIHVRVVQINICIKKQHNRENNHATFKNRLLHSYTKANFPKEESDVGMILAICKANK